MTARARYFLERRDREDYASACGRIRVLEKRLLGKERLSELSAAGDISSALHLLRRWGWIGGGEPLSDGRWGETLAESLRRSDRFLEKIDPHPVVIRLLMLKYDLLNLGAVWRAGMMGRPYDGPMHSRGRNSLASLEVIVNRRDFSSYPEPLSGELHAAVDLQEGGDGGRAAEAIAAARHRALREAAAREGSRLFCDWLDHFADFQNIIQVCRAMAFPGLRDLGPPTFPGGCLEGKLSPPPENPGELRRLLAGTVYGPLFESSLDSAGKPAPSALEGSAADFLVALLEPARYVSLGPEPLWAYWIARETDARNIRTVLVGLERGAAGAELPAPLRRPYV